VSFGVVGADPHHLGLAAVEGPQILLEAPRLQGATTGEILGIKVENQPTAGKITQPQPGFDERFLSICTRGHAREFEVRGGLIQIR
jgi:hypothetical protein